jgi:periplasmic protein TonB
MSHTINLRAASLTASALTVGAALLAALTVSYSVQTQLAAPSFGFTFWSEPPPPPPEPARPIVRTPPDPDALFEFEPFEPLSPLLPAGLSVSAAPPAPLGPVTIDRPHWLERPSRLERLYPRRARESGIEGAAQLDCLVSVAGALDCVVIAETPANWGFGAAALRIADEYRMAPATRDGVPVEGRYRLRIPFELN